jgi:hypothetical protein
LKDQIWSAPTTAGALDFQEFLVVTINSGISRCIGIAAALQE